MAFSFRGLDIRHRLPDTKRSREFSSSARRRPVSIGVSTPQDGAYPSHLHHPAKAGTKANGKFLVYREEFHSSPASSRVPRLPPPTTAACSCRNATLRIGMRSARE